jgi:hypothetical protein
VIARLEADDPALSVSHREGEGVAVESGAKSQQTLDVDAQVIREFAQGRFAQTRRVCALKLFVNVDILP